LLFSKVVDLTVTALAKALEQTSLTVGRAKCPPGSGRKPNSTECTEDRHEGNAEISFLKVIFRCKKIDLMHDFRSTDERGAKAHHAFAVSWYNFHCVN
jgi:hypothetical protein